MHLGGMPHEDMLAHVQKKDGSQLLLNTLDGIIARKKADPDWFGEDSCAGGRPRQLADKQVKSLVDFVFAERGGTKVTIGYCKKRLRFLRPLNEQTVANALHDAGLKWLTRRQKSWVPPASKEARLLYADWLLGRHAATLQRFAYIDGTTFYLARGLVEHGDKKRKALGRSAGASRGVIMVHRKPRIATFANVSQVFLIKFLLGLALFLEL